MPLSNGDELPIWVNAVVFLAAAVAVWGAGTRLTRNVDGIARATGLGQAFAGMLFLSTITTLPELTNTVASSWLGNPALAINNLLGSASINIVLLALADAFIGRDAVTSVVARPVTLMVTALSILLLAVVAVAIVITDVPFLGVGVWSIIICTLSIGAFWLAKGYDDRAPWVLRDWSGGYVEEVGEDVGEAALPSLLARGAAAAAVILVAGTLLSATGDALARQTGLGTGLVGFALLGLSTSLPELSAVTTALRLRRYEMAFGHVMGANFINLSLILVADIVFVGGPVVNQLGRFETISAMLGALLIGTYLVGLLERRNPTVMRMGYDSLAVIVLFAVGLVLLSTVRHE